jgi:calpain-15
MNLQASFGMATGNLYQPKNTKTSNQSNQLQGNDKHTYSFSTQTQPTQYSQPIGVNNYSYQQSSHLSNQPTYQQFSNPQPYIQQQQHYGSISQNQYQGTSNQQFQPSFNQPSFNQPSFNQPSFTQPSLNQKNNLGQKQNVDLPTNVSKHVGKMTKEEMDELSKTAKDLFSDAFSKSSTNPSYKQLLEQANTAGKKYQDLEFPTELRSLTGGLSEVDLIEAGNPIDWRSLIWLRSEEIYGKGNFKVFLGDIEPADIRQGSLGDCYFLSTLASLAEKPSRIKKLFETDQINEPGIYGIKICDLGEWKTILVDDRIPCSRETKEPIFTRGNGGEIWVELLEKAWAKVYGGYARIEAGLTRECLHDLTGAPTQFYLTGNPNIYEQIWKDLANGEQKDFAMTCGAGDLMEGADLMSSIGLVGSHAYSLLSAVEIKDKSGQLVKLVKLRNPWGQGEWTGDWSDNSSLWTPELRAKLNVEKKDDGSFYICYEDFLKYFSDVQICHIHDDYIYRSLKTTCGPKHAVYFKLKIKKAGHYYLTVNQESKRKHLPSEDYKYSEVAIVFGKKLSGGNYEYVEGFQRSDKEVWTDGELSPGEYIVYVKINWREKKTKEFTLSTYGLGDTEIEVVPKSSCSDFLEKVYQSKAKYSKKLEDYSYYNVKDCFRAVELTDDGFGYVYYRNNSKQTLEEELFFKVLEGLRFRKPYRGNTIKVSVKPGEEKIIITKVDLEAKRIRQAFTEKVKFS